MFCRHCGAEIDEDAVFCPDCGERVLLEEEELERIQQNKDDNFQPQIATKVKPKRKKGKAAAAIFPIVLVLIFAFLFIWNGAGGVDRIALKYFEGVFESDADKIMEILPGPVLAHAMREDGYDSPSKKKMKQYVQNRLDEMSERRGAWEYYSASILSVADVSAPVLEEMQKEYRGIGLHVNRAKTMTFRAELSGDEKPIGDIGMIFLVKIRGRWYVDGLFTSLL